MIDIINQLNAIHREVARGEEDVTVRLRRTYDTDVEDVWNALTDPERIRRWFMPISGELRVGGRFQMEGNASGEILHCEPPHLLRATWGRDDSVLEVRLSQTDDHTTLELQQTVPLSLARSGAGAFWVGPGWDGAIMGLDLFLRGEAVRDPVEVAQSSEVQQYSLGSIDAWQRVVAASGTATGDEITAGAAVARTQFAPDL